MILCDAVLFYNLTDADAHRMIVLMMRYQDRPMDLADASLVVAAEARNVTRVFTTDQDFYAYRINDRTSFEVVLR